MRPIIAELIELARADRFDEYESKLAEFGRSDPEAFVRFNDVIGPDDGLWAIWNIPPGYSESQQNQLLESMIPEFEAI